GGALSCPEIIVCSSSPATSTPSSSRANASFRVTSIPSTVATFSSCVSCPLRSSMLAIAPSVNSAILCRLLLGTPRLAPQPVELRARQHRQLEPFHRCCPLGQPLTFRQKFAIRLQLFLCCVACLPFDQ